MNVHQTIIKGIKDLLFEHNYLVIPGFGGFVLKKVSSHFSPNSGMLFPPTKTISFNSQLKQNDGVLALWVQSSISCDNKQAINHLEGFAEYCRSILNNKGRLNINDLGFFYTDLENNICFEPQQQLNFLSSSFGLSPVTLKEIEIVVPIEEETKANENVFIDRTITLLETEKAIGNNKIKRYRKIAVAAVSGAILFSALLFVVSNTKISGQLRSAFVSEEDKTVYTTINYNDLNLKSTNSDKKDYVADANGIAELELETHKTVAVRAIEIEPVSTKVDKKHNSTTIRSTGKNFEVVLGCFSILTNAGKMVKQLKSQNVNAVISGQNEKGLYVVSSGGFDTKDEAIAQLNQVKNSCCPKAWIRKP